MNRSLCPGARLLIVEEGLKDYAGHWFRYVHGVAQFNEAAGVDVEVAAHVDVRDDFGWSLPVHRTFSKSKLDPGQYSGRRGWKRVKSILRSNLRVYRELRTHFEAQPAYDLVFVPSVLVHQLLGWWPLLWRFGRSGGGPAKIGRAVLLLHGSPAERYGPGGEPIFGRQGRNLCRCIRAFRGFQRRGLVGFATGSERLSHEYEALCGMPFDVFPSPQVTPRKALSVRERAGSLLFSALGYAHLDKGILVLQDAIRRVLEGHPDLDVRFVIHWPNRLKRPGLKGQFFEPDEVLAASERVEFVQRSLTTEEYDELLLRSDCVVLPYRLGAYRARGSGVVIEATTAGVPVIVTAGTTLDEARLRFGAGLSAADGDAADLAVKILAVADDAESFRAQACERLDDALAYNSASNFLAHLWDCLPESSSPPAGH